MIQKPTSILAVLASLVLASELATPASAQSSLVCPAVSVDTQFTGPSVEAECTTTVTDACTTKTGVMFDGTTSSLRLPGSSGNFQAPPGAAVEENVYYAAAADFDRDGWDDFVAADNTDRIYVMRNQTITCGTTSCSGSSSVAPSVQTIPSSWWDTLTNVRPAAFRKITGNAGLKPQVNVISNAESPMAAGDFNGDGWPDVAVISGTVNTGGNPRWPGAARLFLNTQNCRSATNTPCGAGTLCSGQPANGACTGWGVAGSGTPFAETDLSCANTNSCTRFFPTFATYDLRTGAAVSAVGTTSATSPTTYKPGDFGPVGHSAQNMVVVDWDGDGDLDLLVGHGPGTCPGSLCEKASRVFYTGVDVWKNDCAQSPQWNAATKSCIGHIPKFSRDNMNTCSGTTCNNPDTLIPSTAHNTTTLAPNTNLGFDVNPRQNPGFAYIDIDQDGDLDLVVGSPGCCSNSANSRNRLRVFKGTSNNPYVHNLDTANPLILSTSSGTYPGYEGSLTGVFVSDFSGDGWPDIITGSDGVAYSTTIGGRTRYWRHTGDPSNPYGTSWPSCSSNPASCTGCSSSCNPNPTTKMSESCGNANCANLTSTPPRLGDFDIGFMLDYDHDPQRTLDMALTNGNNTGEFYLFPNRASPSTVAACGSVVSGTLPTPDSELTVNGACIAPNSSVPTGTSITYYLNNESPSNWQLACTQTGSGSFDPPLSGGQCCVTFPNNTGRTITWKAVLDSNTSDGVGVCEAIGTDSPTISGITANYTYTEANQHYKAGVVISDGVTYVGSYTQPGNRGRLHALAAGDGTKYFDVAEKLDAQSSRNVFTTDLTGTGLTRIPFSPSSPSIALQGRVGASDAAEATAVIDWVLSPRFGIADSGFAPTRLGAVQNSTPAVLAPPFRPNWYSFLVLADKALYDAFSVANATRLPLVLFASMDGMLHAIISNATNISHAKNGEEAWAFVPPYVAANMKADYQATQATGKLTITSYPDGSPGLLDFKKASGEIATAAIVSDGVGGSSVTVLDVTDTIDASSFSVAGKGPDPLWSHQPGGAAAGLARSKPGVARTKIGGAETYVVVAGTGILATDSTKGRIVAGYDLETGKLLWRFEMECPLTSDITIFETDDEDPSYEPGAPLVDGWADRAVFADQCGYVYKLDPAQDADGAFIGNAGFGPIVLPNLNGQPRSALFSTRYTAGALGTGGERPIVGTIGARTDSSTDMVLFFGTGGLEGHSATLVNEFYAVYAKNGAIRNKVTGSCTVSGCEKFYGGVVVTPELVILQRSIDPVIGGGTCDFGSSRVQAYGLNAPYSQQFDITSIEGMPIHAVSGPLYGDAGALYFATVSGEIKRIGAPRATEAGGDSASGAGHGMGVGESSFFNAPFTMLGWRVVL